MKKALALILAIAMVFALAACGQTSAPANEEIPTAGTTNAVSEKPAKVYQWRFQSTENESIAMYRARNELCQKIAEETNGGLIITQYAGGAIISDMNIPDAVSTGTIEMGNVYLNPLYASVPTSNMVGILPGFMFNVAELRRAGNFPAGMRRDPQLRVLSRTDRPRSLSEHQAHYRG